MPSMQTLSTGQGQQSKKRILVWINLSLRTKTNKDIPDVDTDEEEYPDGGTPNFHLGNAGETGVSKERHYRSSSSRLEVDMCDPTLYSAFESAPCN